MSKVEVLKMTKSCRDWTPDVKHLSRLAWELSRSVDDATPLESILAIDAPVNELPSVVLNITCSVLEREILTTPRDHVMWARTSRVDDPANMVPAESVLEYWNVPTTDYLQFLNARDKMREIKAAGQELQDNYRMGLLMSAETSFTTTLNLRSLIKMIKTFDELIETYEHLSPLQSLRDGLFDVARDIVGGGESDPYAVVYKLLQTYKSPHYFDKLRPDHDASGRVADVLVVSVIGNLSLRAQVVRHRTLHVEDDFASLLASKHCWLTPIGAPCQMQISAPVSIWHGILSKRMCWIAQHDLWKVVLDKAMELMPREDVENMLPCSGGVCPYVRDAEIRYTIHDPGPVCPRFAKIYRRPIPEDQKSLVTRVAKGRPYWEALAIQTEFTSNGVPSK